MTGSAAVAVSPVCTWVPLWVLGEPWSGAGNDIARAPGPSRVSPGGGRRAAPARYRGLMGPRRPGHRNMSAAEQTADSVKGCSRGFPPRKGSPRGLGIPIISPGKKTQSLRGVNKSCVTVARLAPLLLLCHVHKH